MANAHEYDDNNENGAPSNALPDFRPPELRQAAAPAVAQEAAAPEEGTVGSQSAPQAAAGAAPEAPDWQKAVEVAMKLAPDLEITPEGAAAFQAGLRGEPMPPVSEAGAADAQRAYDLGRQERETRAAAEVEPGGSAEAGGPEVEEETVSIFKADLEALMAVAAKVQKNNEGPEVNQEDLERVNRIVSRQAAPISDQVSENVQSAIATGGQAVAGLVRGTLAGVRNLMMGAKTEDRAPDAPGVSARAPHLFPRLSDYRVVQLEKNVREYGDAVDSFWKTGPMPNVRKAIEERARTTGASVEDVMEKMKPSGEYADLHQRFVEAVGGSSEAQDRRKAMNKAIDGFVRQYSSAQEELIAPYEDGNPHYDKLKQRVGDAREQMLKKAGTMPRFDGDKASHLERLKEMIQKIMDKVREAAAGIAAILRGKSNSAEVNDEPAP